jgi:hypothetical protein
MDSNVLAAVAGNRLMEPLLQAQLLQAQLLLVTILSVSLSLSTSQVDITFV